MKKWFLLLIFLFGFGKINANAIFIPMDERPTDLNIHPHSTGYQLILNDVLFPSARKKKRKT